MSSLYDITGDLLTLQNLLSESVDDEQVLLDTLEGVQGEYEYKLESYCKIIKNLEADTEALKNEAKRLSDKRKVLENNIDRLKKAMFDSMRATGTDKVKGQIFTVAIQKNGGKLPVIAADNVDLTKLPDELIKVVTSPDLEAIREWLETGNAVEGFTLGERGESLRIK